VNVSGSIETDPYNGARVDSRLDVSDTGDRTLSVQTSGGDAHAVDTSYATNNASRRCRTPPDLKAF